jgi:hypothetical protein
VIFIFLSTKKFKSTLKFEIFYNKSIFEKKEKKIVKLIGVLSKFWKLLNKDNRS